MGVIAFAGFDPDERPFARKTALSMGYTLEFIAQAKQTRERLACEEMNRQGLLTLRRWGMPEWARDIVSEVCRSHDVFVSDVASACRRHKVVYARNEAIYRVKESKMTLSSPQIARWFNRDHVSVLYSIASHQHMHGLPKLVGYDLERSRETRRKRNRKS
jgi:hypothetical protein